MLLHVDAVHGTYYLALHVWVHVFGYSAFAIRLPSAIAIGACVATVVWASARIATLRTGVIVGIVCAILPRLTYAGGEARSFAFDAMFAAILFGIIVAISQRSGPQRKLWVLYGVVLVVATYFFIYTGLITFAVGGFIALTPQLRAHWRPWLVTSLSAVVVTSPILILAFAERGQISYLGTADYASWDVIFKQMWFGDEDFAWLGWASLAIAIILAGARLMRSRSYREMPATFTLGLTWAVIPTALLLLGNCIFPLFTARYAAITAPAVAILIAFAIDELAGVASHSLAAGRRRSTVRSAVSIVLVGVAIAVALPEWAAQRGPYAENQSDWNEIATTIAAKARAGDGIIFDPTAHPSRDTRLAYDTAAPGAFGPVQDILLETPAARSTTWYATTYSVSAAVKGGRLSGISRLWVVEYRTPVGLTGSHTADHYALSSLAQLGYRKVSSTALHASEIYLFAKPSVSQ